MRLIGQKVDALAVLQLYKFSDERLLTGASLNYRLRPAAVLGGVPASDCFWLYEQSVADGRLDGTTRQT